MIVSGLMAPNILAELAVAGVVQDLREIVLCSRLPRCDGRTPTSLLDMIVPEDMTTNILSQLGDAWTLQAEYLFPLLH